MYRSRNFERGWRVPVAFSSGIRQLDLMVTRSFPFSAPRISLVDRPPFLIWPHIEGDGMLCLLGDDTPIDVTQPKAVAHHVFGQAVKLISELENGQHIEHFQDEFATYWNQSGSLGREIFSLLDPLNHRTRRIHAWIGVSRIYVGESSEDVSRWLRRQFGDKPQYRETVTALFVQAGDPFLPTDYPRNSRDVHRILVAANAERFLADQLRVSPGVQVVVFGFRTQHGPAYAGVTLMVTAPDKRRRRIGNRVGSGFRINHAPPEILMGQFLGTSAVRKSSVERVDHDWIHGRDHDDKQVVLKESVVAVFGCGSVGSFVAHQLALAGIGTLYLVDPQALASANVGRHYLGAKYIGTSKAQSLAKELQEHFPHLSIQGFRMGWEQFHRDQRDLFDSCSVVLSLMGDWNAEAQLNSVHLQSGRMRDFIYGWTEAYALAGHAVAIRNQGGCFACQFDAQGNAQHPLIRTTGDTRHQEPACGALFQPYGPVELNATVSLIADLTLRSLLKELTVSTHRVWKGSSTRLAYYGDHGKLARWSISALLRSTR